MLPSPGGKSVRKRSTGDPQGSFRKNVLINFIVLCMLYYFFVSLKKIIHFCTSFHWHDFLLSPPPLPPLCTHIHSYIFCHLLHVILSKSLLLICIKQYADGSCRYDGGFQQLDTTNNSVQHFISKSRSRLSSSSLTLSGIGLCCVLFFLSLL